MDGRRDQPTNKESLEEVRTDRPTDVAFYRVTCTRLKREEEEDEEEEENEEEDEYEEERDEVEKNEAVETENAVELARAEDAHRPTSNAQRPPETGRNKMEEMGEK